MYVIYANQVFELKNYTIRRDLGNCIQDLDSGKVYMESFPSRREALFCLKSNLERALEFCKEDIQKL